VENLIKEPPKIISTFLEPEKFVNQISENY